MQEINIEHHTTIRDNVLKTLRYFHMFRHPLYSEDILSFINVAISPDELKDILADMTAKQEIYVHKGLYMLEDNPNFSDKRLKGAEVAEYVMQKAVKSAAIIGSFPFVKSICISGSLSKGYADEKSDIDYFIITQQNRLWICRSLLHLYKKFTFIIGKQHSFCMNYFLDESHPELEEKNIFTATEMVTLYPVYGHELYTNFIQKNETWLSGQFPNKVRYSREGDVIGLRLPLFKKASQLLLNIVFPTQMNRFFMKLTDRWWRYKWQKKNYPMQDYEIAMKTKIYVSKNHPANYQKKVLNNIDQKPMVKPVLQVR